PRARSRPRARSLAGPQLVARVEHDAFSVELDDEALGTKVPSRLDPGDEPSAEEDEGEGSRSVVELSLERLHAVARAPRDRAEHAGDPRAGARLDGGDGGASRLDRLGALRGVVELRARGERAIDDRAQAHRISVISG